jgi:glycosyltransferase involved in cell wall biosynthesis
MRLLRLANTMNATSAPYNQFSLGFKGTIVQTFCSLFKPDILSDKDINGFHGDGSIFKMFKLIKELVKKNEYDVVHIHSGLTGIIFIIAIFPIRISLLKKTVFTLHNSWNVLKLRNQFLNFIVMLASNKVCTCGNSSRDSLPKIINYFVGKKTKAIVNGFDYQRIDGIELKAENKRHFKKSSEVKIVYIGALNNKKNQIALLKSVKLINMSLEIIFLGDGANRNVLVNYSKNISSSVKINFKGIVSRDIAIEHMLEADVCVSLSKGEGLPIAVLEAMYAGCFMILSIIKPHKEVSPPAKRCLFVNSSSEDEIINALSFVNNNIENIRANRKHSKEYAKRNFSATKMLFEYKKVYSAL